MSTTTRPTPVLSPAQVHELWELFCQYGRLREEQGRMYVSPNVDADTYGAKTVEADQAQMRFGELLASLTTFGAEA